MAYFYSTGKKIELAELGKHHEMEELVQEFRRTYAEETIRQQAKMDGELGIPCGDEPGASPYESELQHAHARMAGTVAGRYKGPLEALDASVKAERDFVERKFKNALQRIEAIYDTEKTAAEDAFGLADAHKRLALAETHFEKFYQKYGRGPVRYIPPVLYWVFAAVIFIGEIPMNALVFRIFGENEILTWVMAFVIGLAIPVAAHFVGIKVREHADGFSIANALKALASVAVVIAALYGVAILRQVYLQENSTDLGLSAPLVQSSFLFFWLNLAVLGAAIAIAYLAHDSVPGFEQVAHDVKKWRKQVQFREDRRVKKLKESAVNRNAELDKANTDYRDDISRVNLMKGTYDQLLKEGQEYEARCLDRLMQDISRYRHENLRCRPDKKMPKAFSQVLNFELELPKIAEKLDNGNVSAESFQPA